MKKHMPLFLVVALFVSAASSWDLQAQDTTVLVGTTATIKCLITKPENDTTTLFHSWKDTKSELASFENVTVDPRFTVAFNDNEMWLKITDVQIKDEGDYDCGLAGLKPPPHATPKLTVHQRPEVSIQDESASPLHGQSAAIAKCIATGSKPAPDMWFTDEFGGEVVIQSGPVITDRDDKLVDAVLTLEKTFYKSDHQKRYKCHVRHVDDTDETEQSMETQPVNVLYGTTASFKNLDRDEVVTLQEETPFEAWCETDGNPYPTVNWEFIPDDSVNVTMGEQLPSNFQIENNGRRLFSSSVILSDEVSTNNGTFTCTASNGIGDDVFLSFRLGVYAAPVTTVPTTPEVTPGAEPQRAGSDAAVIGGVVAVAVFVLIVAIVLIARYFMSHKGTYHTHEVKARELEENRGDSADESKEMLEEENELGEKKRTEYFM